MRISDWSSDVCSSDLHRVHANEGPRRVSLDRLPVPAIFHTQHDPSGQSCDTHNQQCQEHDGFHVSLSLVLTSRPGPWTCCLRSYIRRPGPRTKRSEEHTSELQSLMRISYAGFCLQIKTKTTSINSTH